MKPDKILYGVLLTTALCVSACGFGAPDPKKSGDVLLAEQGWVLNEEDTIITPVKDKLDSGDKVVPENLGAAPAMLEKPAAAPAPIVEAAYMPPESVEFRLLRLERMMKEIRSGVVAPAAKSGPIMLNKPGVVMGAAPPPQQPIVQFSGGALSVLGVRVGEHQGKTRFVIDLSAHASGFTADLDNDGNILIVNLPNTSWDSVPSKTFENSLALKSYTARASATGTQLAIELQRPVKVLLSAAMKPNEVHGHRVVFDFAPL